MAHEGIDVHAESAEDYDRQAAEYRWYGGDILFGLVHEYLTPTHPLLDVGIGTGLSSAPFRRLGMTVCGVDGSREMLEVCAGKNIAADLKRVDLSREPLPFDDGSFGLVISSGVFHFLDDLAPLFAECVRVLRRGGVFAFTVVDPDDESAADGRVKRDTAWGVSVTAHGRSHVETMLGDVGLVILKDQKLLMPTDPERSGEMPFRIVVAGRPGEIEA